MRIRGIREAARRPKRPARGTGPVRSERAAAARAPSPAAETCAHSVLYFRRRLRRCGLTTLARPPRKDFRQPQTEPSPVARGAALELQSHRWGSHPGRTPPSAVLLHPVPAHETHGWLSARTVNAAAHGISARRTLHQQRETCGVDSGIVFAERDLLKIWRRIRRVAAVRMPPSRCSTARASPPAFHSHRARSRRLTRREPRPRWQLHHLFLENRHARVRSTPFPPRIGFLLLSVQPAQVLMTISHDRPGVMATS